MKKIDTSQAMSPLTLQPFGSKSLKFLQDYNLEAIKTSFFQLVANNINNYDKFVIFGVDSITSNTITSGYIYIPVADSGSPVSYSGQFIEVVGASTAGFSNPAMLVPVISYESFDPTKFSDGSLKDIHYTVKFEVQDTTTPGSVITPDGYTINGFLYSTITLANGWRILNRRSVTQGQNDGGSYNSSKIYHIKDGVVYMRLSMTAGNATAAPGSSYVDIPESIRTGYDMIFPVNIKYGSSYLANRITFDSATSKIIFDTATISFSSGQFSLNAYITYSLL